MGTFVLFLILFLVIPGGARAESATEEETVAPAAQPAVPAEKPPLNLDRLLRPPRLPAVPVELRGGKDRKAWATDFSSARGEIVALETRIATAQERIRDIAPGNWSYSPTGGGAPTDPEVLRLRAELRRDRQSLEAARQRLRDLDVEASLAGVPDEWKKSESP